MANYGLFKSYSTIVPFLYIARDACIIISPATPSKQFPLFPICFFKRMILSHGHRLYVFTASCYLGSAWLSSRDWYCKELSSLFLFCRLPIKTVYHNVILAFPFLSDIYLDLYTSAIGLTA